MATSLVLFKFFTLLKKALKILKPGHEMIYSTCSVLAKENEDILNKELISISIIIK